MDRIDLNLRKILVISTFSLLLFSLYHFIKWYMDYNLRTRRIFKVIRNYKTPAHLPLIGHALQFMGTPTGVHSHIIRICFKYGPNFAVWILDHIFIVVGKPDDVEKILQSPSCLTKNELYRFTHGIVGTGLFTAPPEKWRQHRKIISPTFNAKILEGYLPIFCKTGNIFVDEILPNNVDKKDADWYTLFTAVNLDVIMQTAMGIDKDVQRKDVPFGQWLENAMRSCFIRMVKILYYPDFIFYRTRMGKLLKKYTYKINKFTEEIIQEKRRKFKEDLDNNEYRPVLDEGSTRPIGKKVFLDFLLELDHKGMNFTDKDLRDEVNTFFVGGTDTSAVTACFFLTMMGMHQDIQEKVYEEVMGVLGPEGQPTVKDLNEMHFFERCLKETMRLFTPAPIILRKNTGGDLKISDGVIPVGASIAICFFYIHRSDLYWNNPLKFDPDRFLPEEMAKRHPYTFLPFSAGFRGCIGQRFALLNLKTQLSLIMRKYRIYCDAYKSVEEIQLKSVLVLRPIHGFKFRLVKRQQ